MPDFPAAADQPHPLSARAVQDTASLLGLLSSTVRLHLLWLLASGAQDVTALAEATGQTVATVSHHLGKLKLARIVDLRRDGRRHIYVIADPHVVDVLRVALEPHLQRAPSRRKVRRA